MADRTIKPDDTHDLVLQNNDGSSKLELNEDQTVKVTTGSSSGDDFTVNTTKLIVEGDTGNVGIGATPGNAKLMITQTATTNYEYGLQIASTDDTKLHMYVDPSNYAAIRVGDNSAYGDLALLPDGGKVGIGQATPTHKLHVSQATTIGTYDANARFVTNNFSTIELGHSSGYSHIVSNNGLRFHTSSNFGTIGSTIPNNIQMTIATSGDVLIGKTTSGTSVGIQLEPAGAVYSIRSGGPSGLFSRNGSTGEIIRIMDDGADVGSIDTDGSNASYNESSDYRLKENIVDMTDAITRLKTLQPRRFNFIAYPDVTKDGFVAHEAQEVVPQAVTGEKDGMKTEEYTVSEAKGEVFTPAVKEVTESNVVTTEAVAEVILETDVERPEELTEGQQWRETTAEVTAEREVPHMQGIDQSKLVPLLVGALQEAITRIETLENA